MADTAHGNFETYSSIHKTDGDITPLDLTVRGIVSIFSVEFDECEGHIPSGRSETFEITLVENAATVGIPSTNSHPSIHTADGEAHYIVNAEHNLLTIFTVESAEEGHIPSGRSETFENTLVEDAATIGIPSANSHKPIPTADGDITSLEHADHGIAPIAVKLETEGHIPNS